MITAFQRFTRRYTRWIFLLLLAIFIGSLILWDYGMGNRGFNAPSPSPVVINGRRVDQRKFNAYKRMMLLLSGRERRLSGQEEAWLDQQVIQRMVLSEKAAQWGLVATDREVADEARHLPYLQKNGQFDDAAYSRFLEEGLAPRRLSEADFEKMIRDEILIHKLILLVGSTAKITPNQTQAFVREITRKVTVQVCRFNLKDFTGQVHPTPEQLAAFYHEHGDQFRVPEKRKMAYIAFSMDFSKEQVSEQEIQEYYEQHKDFFMEKGKPRSLQEVSEGLRAQLIRDRASKKAVAQATEFTVKLVPEPGKASPSFEALAGESKLPIQQTPFFSESEPLKGIATMAFNSTAFKLTKDAPVSDPVMGGDAVYVLMLKETQQSRPLVYEEAKDAVHQAFTTDAALKMARDKGTETRTKLMALLDQGKTFEQAAASLGIKSEAIRDISFNNQQAPRDPEGNYIWGAALEMEKGEVEAFLPNPTGGLFIYCEDRQAAKSEEIAQLPKILQMYSQEQRKGVVQEFVQAAMIEAKVSPSPSLATGQ